MVTKTTAIKSIFYYVEDCYIIYFFIFLVLVSYSWIEFFVLSMSSPNFLLLCIIGSQMGNPILGKWLQGGTAFTGQCCKSTIYLIIGWWYQYHVHCTTHFLPENFFLFAVSVFDYSPFLSQQYIFAGGLWDTIQICQYIGIQNCNKSQQELEIIQNVPKVEEVVAFVAH